MKTKNSVHRRIISILQYNYGFKVLEVIFPGSNLKAMSLKTMQLDSGCVWFLSTCQDIYGSNLIIEKLIPK